MMSISLNVVVALYSAVVLPYILKVKEEIDVYSPRVVYIGKYRNITYINLSL